MGKNLNKILIVEKTPHAFKIKDSLEKINNIVTDIEVDYNKALKSVKKTAPDIILIDLDEKNLKNGIDLAIEIKKIDDIPIIYTASLFDEKKLHNILKTNPVAYLIKPLNIDELKSNILLGLYKDKNLTRLSYDYYFDKENNKLYYNNELIKLGQKERQLIKILINAKGNIVSFKELEYKIWHNHKISNSTLRTLIYRLRLKLNYI